MMLPIKLIEIVSILNPPFEHHETDKQISVNDTFFSSRLLRPCDILQI